MKIFIGICLVFQCTLISLGVWQILQPDKTTIAYGVFKYIMQSYFWGIKY